MSRVLWYNSVIPADSFSGGPASPVARRRSAGLTSHGIAGGSFRAAARVPSEAYQGIYRTRHLRLRFRDFHDAKQRGASIAARPRAKRCVTGTPHKLLGVFVCSSVLSASAVRCQIQFQFTTTPTKGISSFATKLTVYVAHREDGGHD